MTLEQTVEQLRTALAAVEEGRLPDGDPDLSLNDADALISAASDALAALTEAQQRERRWSMTYGELPELVRLKFSAGYEWDNKNISEQRDWAVAEVARLTAENAELREAAL